MPKGLVEGARDERLWDKAKERVREEYPEVEEDSDRFWRLVNGIYQRMSNPAGPVSKGADAPPVGSGERFQRLQGKLARRGDVRDPAAVAAAIGRKKYGKKRFQEMATAGRVKKSVRPLLVPAPLADQLRKAARQLGFNFDESKHPRAPQGSPHGGQFVSKPGKGTGTAKRETKVQAGAQKPEPRYGSATVEQLRAMTPEQLQQRADNLAALLEKMAFSYGHARGIDQRRTPEKLSEKLWGEWYRLEDVAAARHLDLDWPQLDTEGAEERGRALLAEENEGHEEGDLSG